MRGRMQKMYEDMPAELKEGFSIHSGWRSLQKQEELYRQSGGSGMVARPSPNAPHVRGGAADLTYGSPAARQWWHDNAHKYGLRFRLGNEPWHVEADPKYKGPAFAGSQKTAEDRSAPPDPYYTRKKDQAAPDYVAPPGEGKAAGKNIGKQAAADDAPASDDTPAPDDALQHGGHARGGRPYVVGEGGPELFMPFQSGMVLPNMALKYLKGLQVGGRSLGEYFDMAQSPGRMLSSVLGGGSPLSRALSGFGGGNPLSQVMSGFGGGGGNPLGALSGFMGFQEGGVIEKRDMWGRPVGSSSKLPGYAEWENAPAPPGYGPGGGLPYPGIIEKEIEYGLGRHPDRFDPGSLYDGGRRAAQKIQASGNIDVTIGGSQYGTNIRSAKEGMFETINMNRNMAERPSSQVPNHV